MIAKMGSGRFSLPAVTLPSQPPAPVNQPVPSVQWVTVTPDQAKYWLAECNTGNRPIREDHVIRLASDMEAGNWRGRNGEPIKFDTNGRMFEGQHRCWACVLSGVPFETLMLTGCDPEDFNTSGTGKTKTYADFIRQEKNSCLLAAAIKLVYHWKKGELGTAVQRASPSNAQMDIVLDDHPQLRDSIAFVMSSKCRDLLTSSYACLIHFAGLLEGRAATVESFLDRLGNGLGLLETDPVYHLRKFLLAQRGPRAGQRRPGRVYILALTIKCWNASKAGKPMRSLQFRVDEEFPQL